MYQYNTRRTISHTILFISNHLPHTHSPSLTNPDTITLVILLVKAVYPATLLVPPILISLVYINFESFV